MSSNVVYFAHGKGGGPRGVKIQRLARIARARKFQVESPDYSWTVDPDARVRQLLDLKPSARGRLVLVGSSMGGYVAAVASRTLRPDGLFLMAPAFYRRGYAVQAPRPRARHAVIIHGWNDDVIPLESSLRYARLYDVPLLAVPGDHRLTGALSLIEDVFEAFLDRVLARRS